MDAITVLALTGFPEPLPELRDNYTLMRKVKRITDRYMEIVIRPVVRRLNAEMLYGSSGPAFTEWLKQEGIDASAGVFSISDPETI